MVRTYSEMARYSTMLDRYNYLKLTGRVGESTFGWDRQYNQRFYHSLEWRRIRDAVILRDAGCDLGIEGYEIYDRLVIHHMNPVTIEDIQTASPKILNTNFLVCTSRLTHQAIHYGDASLLPEDLVVRQPGDTKLW